MAKLFYKNKEIKKIGFYGFGKSTRGMLEWFRANYPDLEFTLRTDSTKGIKYDDATNVFSRVLTGADAGCDFFEDILFLSPSVKRERFLEFKYNTVFSSDAEFFINNTKSDVYAITGSDGKSTTVTLTAMILASCYKEAFAIGNIGEAMTPYLDKPVDTAAVCELSSFQLSYFKPTVKRALITNVSPNHLDWHASIDEYVSAKENICRCAKECVLNADCPISSKITSRYNVFSVYSAKEKLSEIKSRYNSDYYVYIKDNAIYNNEKRLLPLDEIYCRTDYNVKNFLAAVAMCADKSIDDALLNTAKSFRGLPHRCTKIASKDGIDYIDSSIDSSPKRTITTLSSFTNPLIVILGGKSKGLLYDELVPCLKEKAKAIFLTGENGLLIKELLFKGNASIPTFYNEDFDEAVLSAAKYARENDTVILSPASTSFDRFSSFEERGNRFKQIINQYLD